MRLILKALCFAILLTACQHNRTTEKTETGEAGLDELKAKTALYISLSKSQRDPVSGWIYSDGCDSLLFNGLYAGSLAASDRANINIHAAEVSPGLWLRRPVAQGNCYQVGGAGSSISKDMILGLIFYAWRAKDLRALEDLEAYGRAHDWVMGEPFPEMASRVLLSPAMVGTLYQVIYKLGGKDHPSRRLPDVYPSGLTDYEAHLQVISILLRAEINDKPGISDVMLSRLKEHADNQPGNPFFQAALGKFTGDSEAAVKLLLDTKHWPAGELPTSANHCSEWLLQREDRPQNSAWEPCPEQHAQYAGGDFIFAASLVLP